MALEARPARNPREPAWMRDYAGVYLLIEKIKRGKDRVRIQKSKPDGKDPQWFTGGFIFKKDRPNSGEHGFMSSIGVPFVYEDPKERDITPDQQAWLKTRVDVIEQTLFGQPLRFRGAKRVKNVGDFSP